MIQRQLIHLSGKLLILLLLGCASTVCGQTLRNPFDFPILLSGNFGELRSNHFHSGIDFKTQGAEGKAVHAVAPGYVSRISISPWGYGNALYLTHPDGTTTVYGHLKRFNPEIAQYAKEQQYQQESFRVDLQLRPEQFPVETGDIIAYSGNTGSSAGPHLHFEVRDTETEEVLDPMAYFLDQITDKRPPKIQGIRVSPMEGKGMVNGKSRAASFSIVTNKEGRQSLNGSIRAWGEIGLAVKAIDLMDQTSNVYGVRNIRLSVDGLVVFESDLDRYSFDETRYLNSFTDFAEWKRHHSFYMRSYIEPGNRLRFIESINRGILTIDEPRTYRVTYTLTDLAGNSSRFSFSIEGEEQPIEEIDTEEKVHFAWNSDNRFGAKGIRLYIPKGNLYNDLYFDYHTKEDSTALATTHILHNQPVALHNQAQLSLRLQVDTLPDKSRYGIVKKQDGRLSWIGGVYRNGWINGSIKELGVYTLAADTEAPQILPVNKNNWAKSHLYQFRLTDNLSGVATYRGEIDGEFVLFEMSNRSVISYKVDRQRFAPGKHTLRITVTDGAGNSNEEKLTITL